VCVVVFFRDKAAKAKREAKEMEEEYAKDKEYV
jgi:hypothetical protein